MGRLFIAAGAVLLLIGAVLTWAPWLLGWFGRLPGDIRVERAGGTFHFPLTSMVVVSAVLSLVLNLWLRR